MPGIIHFGAITVLCYYASDLFGILFDIHVNDIGF